MITIFVGWTHPLLQNSLTWAKYHEPNPSNNNKNSTNAICNSPRKLGVTIIRKEIISDFRCNKSWDIANHICYRHNNWCILRANIIWIALFSFHNNGCWRWQFSQNGGAKGLRTFQETILGASNIKRKEKLTECCQCNCYFVVASTLVQCEQRNCWKYCCQKHKRFSNINFFEAKSVLDINHVTAYYVND